MMKDQYLLDRIVINPKVMVGKPVIKGTRLTVEYILNLLAHGATVSEIPAEYEGVSQKDIQASLLFATRSLENTTFMPLGRFFGTSQPEWTSSTEECDFPRIYLMKTAHPKR
jgi:uncharacterized protein (DUF433 family)